jgi:hypothetical protein
MPARYRFLNLWCFRRTTIARFSVTFICAAAVALSVAANINAFSKTAEDDPLIAKSLATMLRAGRTVISKNQDRINDPNMGNKSIDGKMVLAEASKIYQEVLGVTPASIDPDSRHGKLIRMQLDSIAEVMDTHQETINRQGVGFKGFIPALFGRLANEAFGRRAVGIVEMKVTAPPRLVRNAKVRPDEWELNVIQSRLMSPSWPKDQPYTAMAPQRGVLAQRTLMPEYYGSTCLACHGSPKGEIDITGYPKEGANEGDLGGVISITQYQ